MDRQLSEFMEHVLSVTRAQDSMLGRVASFFGMATGGRQLNYQLQKAALRFAETYRAKDAAAMRAAAGQVESSVLAAETLSAIAPEAGVQLIKELYNLMEDKR